LLLIVAVVAARLARRIAALGDLRARGSAALLPAGLTRQDGHHLLVGRRIGERGRWRQRGVDLVQAGIG
jgi:hypothetical protein